MRTDLIPVKPIKWALCALTVFCVAWALAKNLRGFEWRSLHPNYVFILAAGFSIVCVTFSQIAAYRLLLEAYASRLRWRDAATLSWVPGLAKYVPGKVLAIGSTVVLLRRFQVSAAIALSVALMGDALAVLTGLIAGAPMLVTSEARHYLRGGLIWCILLIVAGLICLFPPVFAKLVNIALRRLKRQPLTVIPSLHFYVLPVLAGFAQWLFWGIALWCAARSVANISIQQIPTFIVIAALSNTIAYLAFFTPGGLGMREIFLFLGLDPLIGHANAAIIVVGLRIVQTIVEIVLCGIGLLILQNTNQPTSSSYSHANPAQAAPDTHR